MSDLVTDCALGIDEEAQRIEFCVGDAVLLLTADQADGLSADLRAFAIELRNGGRVA